MQSTKLKTLLELLKQNFLSKVRNNRISLYKSVNQRGLGYWYKMGFESVSSRNGCVIQTISLHSHPTNVLNIVTS